VLTGRASSGGPAAIGTPANGGGGGQAQDAGQENTVRVGAPADVADEARAVEVITLDTTTFEPSQISVSAGETVTFVVTNPGEAVHEFTLGVSS